MIIIIVLLAIILVVVSIVNIAQVVSFSLEYADHYTTASDFWNTGSFWAWVVGFLIITIALAIIRKVFTLCNGLVVLSIMGIAWIFSSKRNRTDNAFGAAIGTTWILMIFWTAVSFFATKAIFDFTSNYSDITEYLVHGNWLAYIMMFFMVRGVFFETSDDNN